VVPCSEGVPTDLLEIPGSEGSTLLQPRETADLLSEIAQRANQLGWSEAKLINYLQRYCRWPGTVKQLSTLPIDWLLECVAVLDKVCQKEVVAALLARIELSLVKLKWTLPDAVEHCCSKGLWQIYDPIVSYTHFSKRMDRLTLSKLQELAEALENARVQL
jgi:hypothetical protein